MTQSDAAGVRNKIVVDGPIARAFTVFAERFGDFKPPQHNLLAAEIVETVFEPRCRREHLRPRGRRHRMPLGPGSRLRAARPGRVQLRGTRARRSVADGHRIASELTGPGQPVLHHRIGR